MTPEQKRIVALEETVLDLVSALSEARIGFGERFSARIQAKVGLNKQAFPFSSSKHAKQQPPTPPAAPVEEETPA